MENTLKKEFSFVAVTPSLSPENLSLYINGLELFRRNINEIEFLIIRNKFLNSKEYRKLAKIIMKLLDGKLPCVLHFDNLDSFHQMDDLVSKSYGAHFTSSLLMKLKKDDLHKHIENEKMNPSICRIPRFPSTGCCSSPAVHVSGIRMACVQKQTLSNSST